MLAYYGDKISKNLVHTPNGYLICRNVPIARTGKMEYLAQELALPGEPERRISVTREDTEVFQTAACASFEGVPVTDGHPAEDIRPENWMAYARGHVQNVRRKGEYLLADLHVTDPTLMAEILSGTKREISCGYRCNYEKDVQGDYRQTNIRGNHVAVVQKGRAGDTVSIQDSQPAYKKENEKRGKQNMTKNWLSRLGHMANEDANTLEEAELQEECEAPSVREILDKLSSVMQLLQEMAAPQGTGCDGQAAVITEKPSCQDAPALLRKLRPVIAQIQDERQRQKVADALMEALKEEDADPFPAMLDAARGFVEPGIQPTVEAQQTLYNACNPHKSNR